MPGFNLNDYVTVDERIDQFWAAHRGDGSITTELIWVADNGQSVAIRATVEIAGRVVATGIAQEDRGPNGANKTSWWENAETSAIGRALANYGMSLSKARPSREEMQKVQRGEQTPPSRPAPRQEPQMVTYKETGEHLEREGYRYQPRREGAAEIAARQEPRPLRPSAPAEAPADDSWTAFWSWAKKSGYQDRSALDEAAGTATTGLTPAEIRRLIEASPTVATS